MTKNNTPLEDKECYDFVAWLEKEKIMFTHIPNETFTKSWGVKNRNKALGVRKGFPDYCLILPDYRGMLFVEMKRQKGSTTSPEQKVWIEEIKKIEGCDAAICYGADEAIAYVKQFL